MVDQLIIAVLAWFHIFFAVAWLGSSVFFGIIIAPLAVRFSPQLQREFFSSKIAKRGNLFFRIVSGFTILFGLLLLYGMTNGDLAWLGTPQGFRISIGMTLGLIAFLIVNLFTAPHLDRAARILRESQDADPQILPADFKKELRTGGASAGLTMIILLVTLIFMVGAAFY